MQKGPTELFPSCQRRSDLGIILIHKQRSNVLFEKRSYPILIQQWPDNQHVSFSFLIHLTWGDYTKTLPYPFRNNEEIFSSRQTCPCWWINEQGRNKSPAQQRLNLCFRHKRGRSKEVKKVYVMFNWHLSNNFPLINVMCNIVGSCLELIKVTCIFKLTASQGTDLDWIVGLTPAG